MKLSHEPGWPELKVGIIALAAVAVVAYVVLKVDQNRGLFARTKQVQAHLMDLKGLSSGAPVQFSGVEVGSVKKIAFQDDGSVVLTMEVREEIRPFIKTSSSLSIETMGVLGDKFILIHPGKPEDPLLPEGGMLPAMSGGTVFDLMSDTSHAVARAREAVDKLNEILEKVTASKGTLGKLVSDADLYDSAERLVGNLDSALKSDSTLGKLAHDPQLYEALRQAAADLSEVLSKIKSPESNFGKFLGDSKLYDNLDTLTKELTALVQDIKKNPRKYFKVSVF